MKLEQQVCSLELAQKLKELGVKQESYFSWSVPVPSRGKTPQEHLMLDEQESGIFYSKTDWGDCYDVFSAFTVAELGEMLPKGCFTTKTESDEFPWRCEYKGGYGVIASGADTEADARAKMLVYLLEDKLITL